MGQVPKGELSIMDRPVAGRYPVLEDLRSLSILPSAYPDANMSAV